MGVDGMQVPAAVTGALAACPHRSAELRGHSREGRFSYNFKGRGAESSLSCMQGRCRRLPGCVKRGGAGPRNVTHTHTHGQTQTRQFFFYYKNKFSGSLGGSVG